MGFFVSTSDPHNSGLWCGSVAQGVHMTREDTNAYSAGGQVRWRGSLAIALLAGVLVVGGLYGAIRLMHSATVPKASVTTLDGAPVDLTQLAAGKPMVINLWATWCPPCRREMPLLASAQERETEIAFVFANQGEDRETVKRYAASAQIELANVLLDPAAGIGREIGSMALPITLFYDRSGRLVDSRIGGLSEELLADKIDRLRAQE
jgi:thiol-disulfide isomerase/thioredoxin